MWLMLQQETASDYVVATGRTTSTLEFCRIAFASTGLDYESYVETSPHYMRPAEVDILTGDASKSRAILGWEPETTLEAIVEEMVEADIQRL